MEDKGSPPGESTNIKGVQALESM